MHFYKLFPFNKNHNAFFNENNYIKFLIKVKKKCVFIVRTHLKKKFRDWGIILEKLNNKFMFCLNYKQNGFWLHEPASILKLILNSFVCIQEKLDVKEKLNIMLGKIKYAKKEAVPE